MKTKKRLFLTTLILSLAFVPEAFSTILIDVDNPYMDVFVRYSFTNDKKDVHLGVLEGNYHQNNNYGRHSHNPYFHSPDSLYFQIVIKNEQNEDINLQRHDFDIFHGPISFEEVFKEEFMLNEKKGELTYKVKVKVIEHPPLVKKYPEWLSDEDWDKVNKGWVEIDPLEIKILYAELDGKEMRLNGNTWKAIQRNCTIKESLKQNCVIRDASYEDEDFIDKLFEKIEADMATNDAQIEAADQTHDLIERRNVRLSVIKKSQKAATYLERYTQAANKALPRAKRYRNYQKHVEKQLPAIEADIAAKTAKKLFNNLKEKDEH